MTAPALRRRLRSYSADESPMPQPAAATGLVHDISTHPRLTALRIREELRSGGNPALMLALLEAAESLARVRGAKLDWFVTPMRNEILAQYAVSTTRV